MSKLENISKDLSDLTILEVAELIKMLEEKWGVKAAVAAAPSAAGAGAAAASAEEKTDFKVELEDAGSNKIAIIKEVRAITGLGLKEAKDLVESAPGAIIKDSSEKAEAEDIKKKIEAAGGKVKLS